MKLHHALWAGACLLLALAGCSKDSDVVKGGGTYSPIITGISSNFEPAARGAENLLTAQVTNVNNLPLTYRWSVAPGAGTITDITSATARWTPPDSIGSYDVTVTVEAQDGETHFSKTMTVRMAVDNQFIRWTRSEAVKFDPAPVNGGGVLYAEYRNPSVGTSDAYRIDTPLGVPMQLTSGFFSVSSPTPRADRATFAFAAKTTAAPASPSIFILPFGGGDTTMATTVAAPNAIQGKLGDPRFAREGTWLLYSSDTLSSGFLHMIRRDGADLATMPVPITGTGDLLFFHEYFTPNWGPDTTGDGNPDAIIAKSTDIFNAPRGVIILPSAGNAVEADDMLFLPFMDIEEPDWSADGQHVVYARRNAVTNERDIWIINRAATDISQAVRVTSGIADDSHPRFSADGNTIFFVSNRADHYGLNGVYVTERRGTNIWSVAQFDKP
jgi:hypothetical protein